MKIVYLSDAAIPSRATNAIQTMRMCEAFARQGAEVLLLHPRIGVEDPEGFAGDVWSFYGVDPLFRRRQLPALVSNAGVGASRVSRFTRTLAFGAAIGVLSRPGTTPFACYCRSPLGAWIAQRTRRGAGRIVALVLQDLPRTERAWDAVRGADLVVPISHALAAAVLGRLPRLQGKVQVEHDGVRDVAPAAVEPHQARAALNLRERPSVVYTGRAQPGKGADVVMRAAPQLAAAGAHTVVVGKVYGELPAAGPDEATLTGFVPPSQVVAYQHAADVLVLPTTAELPYAEFTSPLKLFEYMTTGRPIVASDLPVLREVLRDGENALLVPPGNPEALAAAALRLIDDRRLAARLAAQALEEVDYYRWGRRAERLLGRLTRHS